MRSKMLLKPLLALGALALLTGSASAGALDWAFGGGAGCGICGHGYYSATYQAAPTYTVAPPTVTVVPNYVVQPHYVVRRTYVVPQTYYVDEGVQCQSGCGWGHGHGRYWGGNVINQGQYFSGAVEPGYAPAMYPRRHYGPRRHHYHHGYPRPYHLRSRG